ncbi:MAG: helicase-exonuclease AddAB subunit AddA [Oscillospiraceae bacterium]|nr:helicase-exonuclease AddAB subunit AddA [Oscillospiraceae bacterium]
MRDFRATASQAAAIESRGCGLLVSAGAGSGKTRVLTQRVLERLTDPAQPLELDRFLINTFTRAAAAELKSRITEALNKELALRPDDRRLRRQSALCRKAQIGTIHSFCAALLRENSAALSLSPDFRILEDERAARMREAALERVLEDWYADMDAHPGFLLLTDTVGAGRDDARLRALVLELHGKMQSHARPALWAEQQKALLTRPFADAGETPWGRELLTEAAAQAEAWSREIDRLMAAVAHEKKLLDYYTLRLAPIGDGLRELLRAIPLGWDRAAAAARAIETPKFTNLGKNPDPALTAHVKARRDACIKVVKKLQEALGGSSEELLDELRQTAPALCALLDLCLAFDERCRRDKRRQNLLDFSDLEHLAAQLLTEPDGSPTALARELAGRYDEIMMDEYQDVSPVQELIFRAVSREDRNRFLVGDVKQSIYRFRLADPGIFTDKYDNYPPMDAAAPGENMKILLRENFRSRREIIDAVNAVFSRCMSRRLGDLDYDDDAALRFGADYYRDSVPVPELFLLAAGGEGEDETPDKTADEAAFVAEKIRALVEAGTPVQGKDGPRPMDYGDVAILMSAANKTGPVYRRVLAAHGVPVAAGQGVGYFRTNEISTALSLLAVLDNPHQDIPLIAALRSPAFGFTADELAAVRRADGEHDLYAALCRAAETDEKSRGFLTRLEALRSLAPDLSAEELVWELMERLDLPPVFSAMPDGAQRRANLLELAALAHRFEAGGYRGLHRFVLWLRRLAERGEEPAAGPGGGAVQIMTIHGSKGLEFPVVFLCDTAKRFNTEELKGPVLVHPELGLGAKLTDLERRVEYPTLARRAVRRRLERELLSEQMRLLYVAMTRAKERLFITASFKDPAKKRDELQKELSRPLPPELLAAQSCFAEWLILAALDDGEEHLKLRLPEPAAAEAAAAPPAASDAVDEAALRALRDGLAFRYPYAAAEALPSKLTATELKGRDEPDEEAAPLAPKRPGGVFRMPDFTRKDRPLTGAQRGTATHLVLQYMDFAAAGSLEAVRAEIERLRQKKLLSDKEAAAVDAEAIQKLFASPIGRRMLAAAQIRREFKFSLLVNAEDYFPGAGDEQVLLQGVVDCCIEEDGALTVIDYKTDAVHSEAELAARAAYYAGQLRAYAAALRRIFGKPVREGVLYFLSCGREVSIAL